MPWQALEEAAFGTSSTLPAPQEESEGATGRCFTARPMQPSLPPRWRRPYSAACRAPYPSRSFSARISLTAASAITVPGGKIAEAPADTRAS